MRLTQPYTPPFMPAVHISRYTQQAIVRLVWTKVEFNVVWFDSGSGFDIVQHWWLCSHTGIYIICCNVKLYGLSNATRFKFQVRVNGTAVACVNEIYMGATGRVAQESSSIIPLTVGDYVEVWAEHADTIDRFIQGGDRQHTYLALHRLS